MSVLYTCYAGALMGSVTVHHDIMPTTQYCHFKIKATITQLRAMLNSRITITVMMAFNQNMAGIARSVPLLVLSSQDEIAPFQLHIVWFCG